MAERFYLNCPLAPGPAEIEGAEAHHLAHVRRFQPGDAVCLFNGDGQEYPALVESIGRRRVQLRILRIESPERELGRRLEVAAPLPKGDRAQFLIEKLTELGVTSFVPLRTLRSVVHPREGKLEKLERYIIEACKQCGRNTLPKVKPMIDWQTYCGSASLPSCRMLAHPGGASFRPEAQDLVIAVGPEGGFVQEEVELAIAAGWKVVSLGNRILRVETAVLTMAVLASLSNPASAGP
jgi:16S rRNA (uracil1498-N3)-methyltransferase